MKPECNKEEIDKQHYLKAQELMAGVYAELIRLEIDNQVAICSVLSSAMQTTYIAAPSASSATEIIQNLIPWASSFWKRRKIGSIEGVNAELVDALAECEKLCNAVIQSEGLDNEVGNSGILGQEFMDASDRARKILDALQEEGGNE